MVPIKHFTDGWQWQDCWQDGPGHYECALRRIERLQSQQSEAYAALSGIAGYFRSLNSIPVERATLRVESPEVQRVLNFLKEAT